MVARGIAVAALIEMEVIEVIPIGIVAGMTRWIASLGEVAAGLTRIAAS